jgi:hypothetical protein
MPHSDADPTLVDVINEAILGRLAHVRTCTIGKVLAFRESGEAIPRADVRVAVKGRRRKEDGTWEQYEQVVLPDLPVLYPKVGSASVYFPLAAGDEVMVLFAERDIETAVEEGNDINPANTARRHSMADGMVLPVSWSQSVPASARDAGYVIEASLIKLGEGATVGAARLNDDVSPNAAFTTWTTAVTAATGVTALPPGPVGDISTASSKVNIE